MFQGDKPALLASRFFNNPAEKTKKQPAKLNTHYIGSDEVGVGDIFGPLVVTAVYIDQNFDFNSISQTTIKDSKAISDRQIMTLAPQLQNMFKHQTVVMTNQKYNYLYQQYQNGHILKTYLHEKAITQLMQKYHLKNPAVIIDAYCSLKNWQGYLHNLQLNPIWGKDLDLVVRAEQDYLAVAVASIISRYQFLKSMQQLQNQFHITPLLGASLETQEYAKYLKKALPFEVQQQIMKLHFKLK